MKTEDFDAKSRSMRATLKLSQDQAAAVTQAFTALGGAFTQTGTQAGASTQGIDKATTSLRNVKQASDDTGKSLGGVGGYFKQLGADILRFGSAAIAFQGIKAGVEGLLDSAVKSQSLTAAFTAISGSAQEGQKQLDFVRGTADKLGFSFTALAQNYKGLSAASRGTVLEGQATRDIFTAVTTASRVLQLSTQDTSGVLLALQQIVSKGTVQSEELRGQIGEKLPGAFGIAARAMGVTEKELSKLLETGSVASNIFIPKFAAQLNKEFAGGAEAASKTFAAASERLGNAFQRIAEAIAASGTLDFLGKILDKLTGIIAAGPNAADALRKVAEVQTKRDLSLASPGFTPSTQSEALIQRFNEQLSAKQAEIDAVRKNVLNKTPPVAFGPGGLEDISPTILNQLEKELRDIEKAKGELLKAVRRAAQAVVGQDDGLTGSSGISNRYARSQDLTKALQAQGDELTKALAALDVKAALAPGSALDIVEEKVKLLDKAIKALEDTLTTNKDLLPLLQGKGLTGANPAFKGADPQALAAGLKIIQAQAPSYGLDPALIASLVYQESRFNPNGVGPVTRFGTAKGAGQLLDSTAAGVGVQDPFNLQQNLAGTMKYFSQLLAQFNGNTALALAAYNAGPGNVTKYGGIPPFPETQKYVPEVLERQQALQGTGPQQLADLIAQRDRLQSGIEATKDFQKDLIAQRKERFKDLDIFGLTLAPEQEAELKAQAKAQHERIKAYAETLDIFGLEISPEQERQIKLIQRSTEALRAYQEQLDLSGGALDAFGRATKVTAEARAVTQAEARLKNLPPELQVEGAQVVDRLRRAAQEATPLFQGLRRASEEFADSFLSTIEQVTQGGIKSFRRFADSVIQQLLRIAQQQVLQPALSGLINTGLQAAAGLLSGYGGSFTTTGTTAIAGNIGTSEVIIAGAGLAGGGPVRAGGAYPVGERGPELFVPTQSGSIMPGRFYEVGGQNGSAQGRTGPESQGGGSGGQRSQPSVIVQMTVIANEPSAFLQPQGKIQRAIAQGVQQASRNL